MATERRSRTEGGREGEKEAPARTVAAAPAATPRAAAETTGAVSRKTMTKQKPHPRKCFVTVTRPAAGQGRGAEGWRGVGPRVTGPRPAAGVAPGGGARAAPRGEQRADGRPLPAGAQCAERGLRRWRPGSAVQPMGAALRLWTRPLQKASQRAILGG